MNPQITSNILKAVDVIIKNTRQKEEDLIKKHNEKIHFIPLRYRILGGMLQSMNIQFGNFLEETITNIVRDKPTNIILEEYSGKKRKTYSVSRKSLRDIDAYIEDCQEQNYSDIGLTQKYYHLLNTIIQNEKTETDIETNVNHDIDLLFKDISTQKIYYAEIKYNDDHDTGKFVDINRKILKTTALLIHEFQITDQSQFQPVLMYFNNKKMKGNNYLPENEVIYRGNRFFETFTEVTYLEIDDCFQKISENPEIIARFDALVDSVRGKNNNESTFDSRNFEFHKLSKSS